ncbi:hypothetical protein Van01_51410 [Micromonospora andamanensis]|uniref:Uncharacterized protein n=1 Tax=Micromonospora andamanensis TaxID=1287068 RepID=A0ABQ4I200_9ACTN|nr:hypothetical protein Van01_51410 [Micromonospora andamanensis]
MILGVTATAGGAVGLLTTTEPTLARGSWPVRTETCCPIEALTVDDEGGIWTAHGEAGWNSLQGSGPVRWAADGTRLWGFDVACHEAVVNATRDATWSYSWPTGLTCFRERCPRAV